jgi:hypothetical protein
VFKFPIPERYHEQPDVRVQLGLEQTAA